MPKVKQHGYLSPESCRLREMDGTPPWGVHISELDAIGHMKPDGTVFYESWLEATQQRREIEGADHDEQA